MYQFRVPIKKLVEIGQLGNRNDIHNLGSMLKSIEEPFACILAEDQIDVYTEILEKQNQDYDIIEQNLGRVMQNLWRRDNLSRIC